jgi:hypothetical protein
MSAAAGFFRTPPPGTLPDGTAVPRGTPPETFAFDPQAYQRWLQMAYATAFQAAQRQRQVAGAAGQWRIRRQPGPTVPGGTPLLPNTPVLGGGAGSITAPTLGRTLLGP